MSHVSWYSFYVSTTFIILRQLFFDINIIIWKNQKKFLVVKVELRTKKCVKGVNKSF